MRNPRVLVTAVGSELAFSVLKALNKGESDPRVFGCDIYAEVVGKHWVEEFYQIAKVFDEDQYIHDLKHIVTKHKIQCIIPTADPEFFILAKYKDLFLDEFNCHVLCNDLSDIKLFNNKWETIQFFKKHNLGTPISIKFNSPEQALSEIAANRLSFPLIIKPNTGGGSRQVFKLNNEEDLRILGPTVNNGIIQEYLYPDTEEYSAGTYRSISNEIFVIFLKRTLKFGMTNTAEVVNRPDLEEYCKKVISKTSLKGSNNIQFRLTGEGPKILEINPRFSGTTGIRANFGFNDAEMWILESSFRQQAPEPKIKPGFVLRFMEEQYHFE